MGRFFRFWFAAFVRTLRARWQRGPLRPSWSLMMETTVAYLRADLRDLSTWPVPEARVELERKPLPRDAIGKVRREVVTDRAVFAPEYRLAPEHPYPAQLDDARAALHALEAAGIPRARIVVAGESAGGTLALALALGLRDSGEPQPNALALISPWLDLTSSADSHRRNLGFDYGTPEILRAQAALFAAGVPLDDPRISLGNADPAGIAPTFVQVGTAELLLDEVRAWVMRARTAGVALTVDEAVDMPHAPPFFASVSAPGMTALKAVAAFVRARLD